MLVPLRVGWTRLAEGLESVFEPPQQPVMPPEALVSSLSTGSAGIATAVILADDLAVCKVTQ